MGALAKPLTARTVLVWWALGFCAFTLLAMLVAVVAVGPTGKALPSAVASIGRSPILAAAVMYFIAVYVGLHVLFAGAWEWVSRPLFQRAHTQNGVVLSFLPLLLGILLANRNLFPDSTFSGALAPAVALAADVVLALIVIYALAVAAAGIAFRLRSRTSRRAAAGVAVLALLFAAVDAGLLSAPDEPALARERPDVIVIGIDGLRPDHVDPLLTPAVHALLAGAARAERAWTPLARTFPAWVSVLTGQYPATHGAYFNLMPRRLVDDSNSLAHQLGGLDYERLYAIDETRFSNIDRSYGFDRVVAPATGAFDFLLSAGGDLPLVNLLANTRAGRWLFPFSHLNRGLPVSYRPAAFERALARAVRDADPRRPLFLVAHFELPHWPYTWAGSDTYQVQVPGHLQPLAPRHYQAAVARADAQLAALVAALERAGRLDNAALVLLSDHGEAFRGHEAQWNAPDAGSVIEVHAGHGTHVLSTVQSSVLLAFRGYGSARLAHAVTTGTTASLVDVRPTLHDWLDIPLPAGTVIDGVSLLGGAHDPRVVTLETGFSPTSIAAGDPDVVALIDESARYYDVDAGGRLMLRDELLPELRAAKQRAAVAGDWLLVALPNAGTAPAWDLVLANHVRREYWPVEGGTLPDGAPLAELLSALCRRFERDAAFALSQCAVGAPP